MQLVIGVSHCIWMKPMMQITDDRKSGMPQTEQEVGRSQSERLEIVMPLRHCSASQTFYIKSHLISILHSNNSSLLCIPQKEIEIVLKQNFNNKITHPER